MGSTAATEAAAVATDGAAAWLRGLTLLPTEVVVPATAELCSWEEVRAVETGHLTQPASAAEAAVAAGLSNMWWVAMCMRQHHRVTAAVAAALTAMAVAMAAAAAAPAAKTLQAAP